MKNLIIAGIFAISSTTAIAGSSDFLSHIGGPEYNFAYGSEGMTFAQVEKSDAEPSLTRLIVESNVDGIAWHDFQGEIITSGPSRISLYEVVRGSPEGLSYRSYHERFPVDTDWDQVARDYQAGKLEDGIAAEVKANDSDS